MSKSVDNATLETIIYDIYMHGGLIERNMDNLTEKYKVSADSLRSWLLNSKACDIYSEYRYRYKQTNEQDIIRLHLKLLRRGMSK